jgi:hypothetical protein
MWSCPQVLHDRLGEPAMRLLDTHFPDLHWFNQDETPHYVILSHTWGEEEVSLQDMQGSHDMIKTRAGYAKIRKCCARAARDGFQYAWIDTCCIDKTNSAELSEAINSMFKWYQNTFECYAYLSDGFYQGSLPPEIGKSKWFSRGWTLQELVASPTVPFFDHDWNEIGTKKSLADEISDCTGIPPPAILRQTLSPYCVAEKMSWAATRAMTRPEDIAYCLLGIFDIAMPILYGEGGETPPPLITHLDPLS